MNEHRRAPRRPADSIVQVADAITGAVVGRIANLSIDGMMLLASRPAREDSLHQFTFQLPDAHGRLHDLEIGMHEQWSEPASVPGQYWVGFHFIDIGETDQARVDGWLQRRQVTAGVGVAG